MSMKMNLPNSVEQNLQVSSQGLTDQIHSQQQLESLTTNHMIENMRTPNIFDIGSIQIHKTSKRVLNLNAVKFKLSQLKTTSIRYEVIYKNLVRDLRKYYSQDFNQMKMMRVKKLDAENFTQTLEEYIKLTFKDLLQAVQLPIQDLIFHLGSLIYPKLMLKLLKNDALAKVQVVNIYNYLYKFSLERLQQFLNNQGLMLLFVVYLSANGYQRIHASPNMVKYRQAYYEACGIMIEQSGQRAILKNYFNLADILQAPTDKEFEEEAVRVQPKFLRIDSDKGQDEEDDEDIEGDQEGPKDLIAFAEQKPADSKITFKVTKKNGPFATASKIMHSGETISEDTAKIIDGDHQYSPVVMDT